MIVLRESRKRRLFFPYTPVAVLPAESDGLPASASNGQKRKWAATEKLRTVLARMQPNVEVPELCRREGINPTQYYGWKNQQPSSATRIFDAHEGKWSAAEKGKEAEMQQLKNVIAEITAENPEPKNDVLGLENHGHGGAHQEDEAQGRDLRESMAEAVEQSACGTWAVAVDVLELASGGVGLARLRSAPVSPLGLGQAAASTLGHTGEREPPG